MRPLCRLALLAAAVTLLTPALARATDGLQPFPSNLLTVPDAGQVTGLRVNLPKPDCTTHPSDCADVTVLNRLDGFNVQPRISIPFSGPIDLSTVSSSTVFLRQVGCFSCAPDGINQVVWEPLTNTLHFQPDRQLEQDTAYLLVVTTGVHDASGAPLDDKSFLHELAFGQTKDAATKAYRTQLKQTLQESGDWEDVATASIFTTQSITADLEKIRGQIDASTPQPAQILADVPRAALLGIQWHRQVGTSTFSDSFLPTPALDIFPGSVGSVVYGTYRSPDYETASQEIPATPTRTGVPAVQSTSTLEFQLFLPAGAEPAGGWPVTIFGHGFTDSKQGAPWAVASTLAHFGLASIAVNVVGHGGGPNGTLTLFSATAPPLTITDGGRSFDQDGNGSIDSTEGVNAAAPDTLVGNRDGLRQTVVDLMQLVRQIQAGIDVNGDGQPDLDASKITYAGQSFGGIYGVDFLAVEPAVRAGVPNVPGGPITEIARISPVFRPLVGLALFFRTPSLYNAVPNATFTNFVENMPLRNLPPVVDTVPGASAIQEQLDRTIWAQQSANPAALAPYVRAEPLPGHPAKSVIVQFAKGDMTVPNPTATAILRAGGLAGRATYYRNDIAGPGGTKLYANPHTFLTGIDPTASNGALKVQVALEAQAQIGAFLSSGGAVTIDPDGPQPVFETPIAGPLPEVTNF
ncbi:MAG TPA: Ig-like domain-containing protein [Gaiellaceae bacterium]